MIVFYTCITGQYSFVPDITDQKIEGMKYVLFHENHREAVEGKGWEYILIPEMKINTQARQRKIKILSHLYLPEAEYTIYLDPSYYLHKSFYQRCLELIKTKPNFITTHDKSTNKTVTQEALYAFNRGTLTYQDLINVRINIKDYFYSSNNCWLVRNNNSTVNKINEDWWNLYEKCYTRYGRDQLLLPSVCEESFIDWYDLDKELHSKCYVYRYDDSPVHGNEIEKNISQLDIINLFKDIRNSENIFLRRNL